MTEAVLNLVQAAEACHATVDAYGNRFLAEWLEAAIEAVKEEKE